MALDAIAFWNDVMAKLDLNVRLVEELHVASPVTRALENYARSISQRAGRLRGGPGEPDAPAEITDFGVQAVLLLSRQDLMSFAWPLPRYPGHFVAIEEDRTAMAFNPNIARNIIAHEIGHTLGLRHNRDPTTLMCGPCRTHELAADRPEYMRLTERDHRRLDRALRFPPGSVSRSTTQAPCRGSVGRMAEPQGDDFRASRGSDYDRRAIGAGREHMRPACAAAQR